MTPLVWAYCSDKKRAFELGCSLTALNPNLALVTPMIGGSMINYAYDDGPTGQGLVLKHHGDPNRVAGIWKQTPLFDAVDCKSTKNVKLLVAAGADIDHQDSTGTTPLIATPYGKYEIILSLGTRRRLQVEDDLPASNEDFASRLWDVPDESSPELQWYNKIVDFLEQRKVRFRGRIEACCGRIPRSGRRVEGIRGQAGRSKAGKTDQ